MLHVCASVYVCVCINWCVSCLYVCVCPQLSAVASKEIFFLFVLITYTPESREKLWISIYNGDRPQQKPDAPTHSYTLQA